MQQHKPYGGGSDAVPFAAGVVIGARGWNFNAEAPGLIESPTQGGVNSKGKFQWFPGENVISQCNAGGENAVMVVRTDAEAFTASPRSSSDDPHFGLEEFSTSGVLMPHHHKTSPDGRQAPSVPSEEGRLHVDCSCGFYGTTRLPGGDLYGDTLGIIEGYGLTLVGTVGFRTSKARIVALCRGSVQVRETGPSWPEAKKMLEDLYAVPVYDELPKMLLSEGWIEDQSVKQVISPQPGA